MYIASEKRYDTMQYRRCGDSGLCFRPSKSEQILSNIKAMGNQEFSSEELSEIDSII